MKSSRLKTQITSNEPCCLVFLLLLSALFWQAAFGFSLEISREGFLSDTLGLKSLHDFNLNVIEENAPLCTNEVTLTACILYFIILYFENSFHFKQTLLWNKWTLECATALAFIKGILGIRSETAELIPGGKNSSKNRYYMGGWREPKQMLMVLCD